MLKRKRIILMQILWLGTLAACQSAPLPTQPQVETLSSPTVSPPSQSSTSTVSPAATTTTDSQSAYKDGINLASSAFILGQQAISPDDWDLVVRRWDRAIQKLQDVTADSQHYSTAQTKIEDYQRNLTHAQQQLASLKTPPAEITPEQPTPRASGTTAAIVASPSTRIPIIERHGGTPVIAVTFNNRRYPMILDTGASHTHITRAMANELGIEIIGQTSVATASNRQVSVDVGYVDAIQVGNITQTNIPVSIGDAISIGLLGNDVYRDFDVLLQVNSVEFRPR